MNVIQNPECLPGAIEAIIRTCAVQPFTAKALASVMTPQSAALSPLMSNGASTLTSSLNAALELKLIHQISGDLLEAEASATLRRDLRRSILQEDQMFVAATRWFLQQDPWHQPHRTWENWNKTEISTWVSNGVQWTNFTRWMYHLGLARPQGGRWIPDPGLALIDELPVLPGDREVEIQPAYQAWQIGLPVLPELQDKAVPAVTFALISLERAGHLAFRNLSDARKVSLSWTGQERLVTHVRRSGL